MSTATHIKKLISGWSGNAALYQLDPPLEGHGFVVVSSVNGWAQETYIFPASSSGEVSSFGELPGSMRGNHTHADALREAGYEIKP